MSRFRTTSLEGIPAALLATWDVRLVEHDARFAVEATHNELAAGRLTLEIAGLAWTPTPGRGRGRGGAVRSHDGVQVTVSAAGLDDPEPAVRDCMQLLRAIIESKSLRARWAASAEVSTGYGARGRQVSRRA